MTYVIISTDMVPHTVLIRNGKAGYRAIMQSISQNSDYLAAQLEASGRYVVCRILMHLDQALTVFSDRFTVMNPREGKALPVVAFKIKGECHYDEFAIATLLRSKNWIIPAYK